MNDIKDRLLQVMCEVNAKSASEFAQEIGCNIRNMQRYLKGDIEPTKRLIRLVVMRYPQYNFDWIMDGVSEKYNKVPMQNLCHVGNNSSNIEQSINTDKPELVSEIRRSKERILDRTIRQIKQALRCSTQEEAQSILNDIIADLEDEKK